MTPWTVDHQAPLSMGFSRQEYWSGLPFPSPGDLPDPGIEPRSPALQADALTSEPSLYYTANRRGKGGSRDTGGEHGDGEGPSTLFPRGTAVKNSPAMQETWVQSLGWEDPLEKGMATHSSILAWSHKESDTTERCSNMYIVRHGLPR